MPNDEFSRFQQAISQRRLEAYRKRPSDTNIELLSTYLWNIALSEALYPVLHNFEIALRNSFHDAISRSFNENWLCEADATILSSREVDTVNSTIKKLHEKGKRISTNKLISELTLGFWVSLTYSNYEDMCRKLFKDKDFLPYLPKNLRTTDTISKQFTSVNKLRNKIFHHNPIWNHHSPIWKCGLEGEWDKILEAIEWISPMLYEHTKHISRFPDIHDEGYTIYRELLKKTMPDIIDSSTSDQSPSKPSNQTKSSPSPPRLRTPGQPLQRPQRKTDLTGSS